MVILNLQANIAHYSSSLGPFLVPFFLSLFFVTTQTKIEKNFLFVNDFKILIGKNKTKSKTDEPRLT